jgi:hypothetical protein
MSSNIIFHKGNLSEIPSETSRVTYVSRPGYVGGIILPPCESGRVDYELHIASETEPPKLTSIASSLWEMRRHAVSTGVKRIMLPKTDPLCEKWTWKDLEKCLNETFAGTGIKIVIYDI